MSEQKHTPGPWSANKREVLAPSGLQVAQCIVVTASGASITHEEAIANASLTAAAPDLLEALKALDMARHTDAPSDWSKATVLCDAAIAKAGASS